MILELCKGVHCVDLGESFQTHVYLHNVASIQPRTGPVKFATSHRIPRLPPRSTHAARDDSRGREGRAPGDLVQHLHALALEVRRHAVLQGLDRLGTRRVAVSFSHFFGKMLLVFGCIGTDFARKYAFCSIFQNLPDSQAEIFEI